MVVAPALASALALAWLVRADFSRPAVAASLALLPLLVALAPSPLELALTVGIEAPIVFALAAKLGLNRWRAALVSGLANALTQPLVHLALVRLPAAGPAAWRLDVAALEIGVWLAEAGVYLVCLPDLRRARRPLIEALAISLAANAASTAVGLLLPV